MTKNSQITKFSQELDQTIGYIHRLVSSVIKLRTDALMQGKITFPQHIALEILSVEKSLKMKAVAKALRVSLPAATGLINRLVVMKMVERVYDTNDRRVIYIILTPKGKETLERIRKTRRKAIEEIFGVLSQEERQTYLGILRKIKRTFHAKNQK